MSYFYKCIEKDIDEYKYLYNFGKNYINDTNSYLSKNYNIETIGEHITKLEDPIFGTLVQKTINDTEKLLIEHGINNSINTNGFVEYHRYLNGKNMPLGIHCDDFGGVNYTVNSVIFYLNKTVEGGDLEIYEQDEKTLKETIYVKPSENKIKIVIMEGNVCHFINKITTDGIRECIVVQLKCFR